MDDPTSGGLLGGLGDALTNNPLLYMGLGLLSQRGAGSSLGGGLLQGMGAYQQNRAQNQQYALNQMNLQRQQWVQQMLNQGAQGLMGGSQPSAAAPPVPPTAQSAPPPPGGSPGPTAGGAAPAPPNPYAPMPMADIQRLSIGGMNPNAFPLLALANGQSPVAASKEALAEQYSLAAKLKAGPIAQLDEIAKSPKPTAYLAKDPGLQQIWQDYAAHATLDPQKDLNDDNLRMAASTGRNLLAASVGGSFEAPAVPLQDATRNGQPGQINPIDHKFTAYSEPELQSVIGAGGNPVLVPKNQAVGREPASPFMLSQAAWGQPGAGGAAAPQDVLSALVASGAPLPRGSQVQQLAAVRGLIAQAPPGTSAADIAGQVRSGQLSYHAQAQAAKSVGGQEGKLAIAENELEPGLQRVERAIAAVNPSTFKGANWLKNAALSQASSPELYELQSSMNALENTYKGIAGRYGSGVSERLEQGKLFNSNAGIPELKAMLAGVRSEAGIARQGVEGAKAQITGAPSPLPAAARPTGAPPPLPPRPGQPQGRKVVKWSDLQ